MVDLSPLMDTSVLQLRKEVPLELVVNMIHKMVSAREVYACAVRLTEFGRTCVT